MSLLVDEENRKRYSQGAAIDAQRYNASNEDKYSPEQLAFADQLRIDLDYAYQGARVFRNCRQKHITVTVNQPGQNRFRPEVRILNAWCEERGIVIKKTAANNFVYELPNNVKEEV